MSKPRGCSRRAVTPRPSPTPAPHPQPLLPIDSDNTDGTAPAVASWAHPVVRPWTPTLSCCDDKKATQVIICITPCRRGPPLPQNLDKHLWFPPEQRPLVLQLGGSDPDTLAAAAARAAEYGYDEINLNCGCPRWGSNGVGSAHNTQGNRCVGRGKRLLPRWPSRRRASTCTWDCLV